MTGSDIAQLDLPLERDLFVRKLIRELAGTLEDVVGTEEAAGYISAVGSTIGDWLDRTYREAAGVSSLDLAQVAQVLVDLKRRIQGDFYLIYVDKETIVLGNRRCPFGDMVHDRPSLCMMTSNVFGRITANNLGYARVDLDETIARGDAGCRVVVHLTVSDDPKPTAREYFAG